MANFIIIAICLIAGMLFRRYDALPKDAHKGINAWLIYIALPAASFKYLPHIQWTKDLLLPALVPVVVWLCGWIYVTLFTKSQKNIARATQGGMKLVAGLNNTSFIGFPLIMAYFSEKELGIAIICDQVTFLLLSTIGITIAIRSSQQQKLTLSLVAKKVFTFPPLIGCAAALILPHFIYVNPLNNVFDKLAGTVGPLALFSIGLQLKFSGWQSELKPIAFTLLYKLILAPLLVFGIVIVLGIKGIIPQISIFEMAMPTLLTSGIIADQYNLNPKLANLVVGLGIIISMFTTALWYYIIKMYLG